MAARVSLSPTSSASICQLAGIKRKRPSASEADAGERPPKQTRGPLTPDLSEENLRRAHETKELLPPTDQLSEENLRRFTKVMNPTASTSRSGSIKRSSSTRSSSTQGTNAQYRFDVLRPAKLDFHVDPPQHIEDAIYAIVDAELPDGRWVEIERIAQKFRTRCRDTARALVGENDFVKILHDSLDELGFEDLRFRTHIDWNDQLKPKIQLSPLDVGSLLSNAGLQQQQVDGGSVPPPPKRQQQAAGQPHIAIPPSMIDGSNPIPANGPQEPNKMPPPSTIPTKEGTIKTPRPDITIGMCRATVITALSSEGFDNNEEDAESFLDRLQNVRESGEIGEPMLISLPAARAVDLVFPFAVVEGKSYSIRQQLIAAENQAAVSAACALKIQLRLDELARRQPAGPPKDQPPTSSDSLPVPLKDKHLALAPPPEYQIPLFFSLCTEGPVVMLAAHWTDVKYQKRKYYMMPLDSVYGTVQRRLVDFFVMVDNVLRWGSEHLLESLVIRLGEVARIAKARAEGC